MAEEGGALVDGGEDAWTRAAIGARRLNSRRDIKTRSVLRKCVPASLKRDSPSPSRDTVSINYTPLTGVDPLWPHAW